MDKKRKKKGKEAKKNLTRRKRMGKVRFREE